MTEEQKEEKGLFPIKISKKKNKLKELQKRYPLAKIMDILGEDIDEDVDVAVIAARIDAKIAAEIAGLEAAEKVDKDRKKAYEETYDEVYKKEADARRIEEEKPKKAFTEMCEKMDEAEEPEIERAVYSDRINELHNLQHQNQDQPYINESLIRTFKEVKDDKELHEQFDQLYNEYLQDNEFREYKDNDNNVVNEHSFSIKSNGEQKFLVNSVKNIDGSGLNLAMIGENLSVTQTNKPMTEEQLKALARYCYFHNINIDEFGELANLEVVKGKDVIGNVPDQFKLKTEELAQNNGEYKDNTKVDEEKDKEHQAEIEREVGNRELKSFEISEQIEAVGETHATRAGMTSAAKKGITGMGFRDPNLVKVSQGWGSTTISVYSTEDDMIDDGSYKGRKKAKKKAFSVKLHHSNPPKVEIYLEQSKKFDSDHAAIVLGSMKSAGSKYFVVPGSTEASGGVVNAFMEAAGKEGVVPLCIGNPENPKKGCKLHAKHVNKILEIISKDGKMDGTEAIDFKNRLLEQLQYQENYQYEQARKNGKDYQTNSTLSTVMKKLEGDVKFGKFQSSYLEQLEEFVNKGIKEGYGNPPQKWDGVDRAAAYKALQMIGEDLANGSLNGKPFDVYDRDRKNFDKLKGTLAQYMGQEKPKVVQQLQDAMKSEAKHKFGKDDDDSVDNRPVTRVLAAIESNSVSYFSEGLKKEFSLEGMKPQFNRIEGENYDHSKYNNGQVPPTPFDDDRKADYENGGRKAENGEAEKDNKDLQAYQAYRKGLADGKAPVPYHVWLEEQKKKKKPTLEQGRS